MSHFEQLVESYRGRGLGIEAARLAAAGRGRSVAEAQSVSSELRGLGESSVLREAQAADRGVRVPLREVVSPADGAMLVAEVAQRRLGAEPEYARSLSTRLMERELRRGGWAHAMQWMGQLAKALDVRGAA